MKKLFVLFAVVFATVTQANELLELKNTAEFNTLIQTSQVPVVVQFSAAWCGPCQNLKAVFKKVVPSYADTKVKVAYVDADINKELRKYLQGGYPTVRTFTKAQLSNGNSFVGSQSETYVRNFLDKVTSGDEDEIFLDDPGEFCPVE